MADIQSNINVNIDTSGALASIKNLQRQISAFQTQMAKGSADQAYQARQLQQNLINNINATGKFAASYKKISTTAESFTTALEKNKLSMGEYFKFAGGATKTFGRLFKNEFDVIEKVARERVKTLQTQYVKLGRDANGAMKAISVRPLSLDMDNLATKTAMAAQKQQLLNQLLKQGSTNLLNFGKNTQWAGRQLMVGFTVPLTLLGSTAAKVFMQMEEQAIKFKRVYGESFTASDDTEKMLSQVRQLAKEFTKYGVEASKTMEMAADAAAMGKMGADLLTQVTEATRLAVLGNVEQQQALETTISVTNAFGVATDKLRGKIDFLNAVENQTVTSIEDLTIAIPKAGPVVQQLGGDVEDLAFFLTAMKEGGINASEGANALKSGLASLINPTAKASEMLGKMGINITGIVEANKGDIKGTVIGFAQALDTLDPLNRARAIEQLFGKFQFSRLSTLFQNVIAEGSQATRVLGLTQSTTAELAVLAEREMKRIEASPMYKFKAAIEEIKISLVPLGEAFLKAVTPIIKFGTQILDKFNGMDEGLKTFVINLVGIAGIIAPAFLMSFGLIANGAANVIKLFTFLKDRFTGTASATMDLGSQTSYMTTAQLEAAAVAASLDQTHTQLTQTFSSEAAAIAMYTAELQRAAVAQERLGGVAPGGGGVPTGTGKHRGEWKGYATGGYIKGPGSGTADKIPIMASNGEVILSAETAQENPEMVSALLSGKKIPGFATAGVVGGDKPSLSFAGKAYDVSSESQLIRLTERITKLSDVVETMGLDAEQAVKIVSNGLDKIATGGKVNLEKFNTMLGDSAGGALKMAVDNTIAARFGARIKGNEGIVKAHGTSGTVLTPEQSKALAEAFLAAGANTPAVQKMLTATQDTRYQSQLTFPKPAIANKGKMSGQDLSTYVSENKDAFVSMIAEQHNLDPAVFHPFAQNVATLMGQEGSKAISESQFEEIIAKGISMEVEGAAKKALELSASTITTAQMPYQKDGKVDFKRESLPSGTSVEMFGKTFGGKKSWENQDISALHPLGEKVTTGIIQSKLAESKQVGTDITSGLAQGISAGEPAVMAATDSLGKKTLMRLKDVLGVRSPSIFTAEMGDELNQGMADGLNRSSGIPEAAATASGQGTLDAFGNSTSSYSGKLAPPQAPDPFAVDPDKYSPFANPGFVAEEGAQTFGDAFKKKMKAMGIATGEVLKNASMDALEKGWMKTVGEKFATAQGAQVTNRKGEVIFDGHAAAQAEDAAANGTPRVQYTQQMDPARLVKKGEGYIDNSGNYVQFSKDEKKQQKKAARRRASGRVAMGMGAVAGIAGMASAIPGLPKEVAGGIQSVVAPLSAAATTMAMIPGPAGMVAGALVGLGTAFAQVMAAAEETRKKSSAMAQTLGAGADSMKRFAEFAGKASASEIASKRREQSLSPFTVTQGKTTFGQSFVQSEAGKTQMSETKEIIGNYGTKQAAQTLATQLVGAVATNIMSPEQAKSIAQTMGMELNNYGLSLDIIGQINKILDENGNVVEGQTLKLFADIVAGQSTSGVAEALQSGMDKLKEIDSPVWWWETERTAKAEGNVAGLMEATWSEQQAAIDGFDQVALARIQAFKDKGQYSEALAAEKTYEADRQALILKSAEITKNNLEAFSKISTGSKQAVVKQIGVDVKTRFEGDAQMSSVVDLIDAASETGGMGLTTQATILLGLKNNTIDARTMTLLNEMFDVNKNSEIWTKIAEIDLKLGSGTTDRVTQILESFNVLGTGADAARKKFIADINFSDPTKSNNVINAMQLLSNYDGVVWKPGVDIQFYQDEKNMSTLLANFDKIDALAAKGPLTVKTLIEQGIIQDPGTADALAQIEKDFAGIPAGQHVQYAKTYLSRLTAVADNEVEIWKKQNPDLKGKLSNDEIASRIAQSNTMQYMSMIPVDTTTPIVPKNNNTGGGTKTNPLDDVLNRLKMVRDASINAVGEMKELMRVLGKSGTKDITIFKGVEQALTGKNISKGFMDFYNGLDAKAKKTYVNITKKGKQTVVALTSQGKVVDAAMKEISLGDYQAGLVAQAQNSRIQQNAYKKLRLAGLDAARALEVVSDAEVALAIMTKGTNAELKTLISNLNAVESSKSPEERFNTLYEKIKSKLEADREAINLKFEVSVKADNATVAQAESELAAIQYSIDDINAGLQEISWQEDTINKSYEKRFEALDKIEAANEAISAQQKGQLTLADALSQGDIAAAARAAQEIRADETSRSISGQRQMLEASKQSQIDALKSKTGLTRVQLEEKMLSLEKQAFAIEEKRLEPAQNRIRLATEERDIKLTALDVEEAKWKSLQNTIDLAKTSATSYVDALKLANAQILAFQKAEKAATPVVKTKEQLAAEAAAKAKAAKDKAAADAAAKKKADAAAAAKKTGSGSTANTSPAPQATTKPNPPSASPGPNQKWVYNAKTNKYEAVSTLPAGTLINGKPAPGKLDPLKDPNSKTKGDLPAAAGKTRIFQGGTWKYIANPKPTSPGNWQWNATLENWRKLAAGGHIQGAGTGTSDSIPAMLSDGEYVIKASSVKGIGVDFLDKLNNGELSGFAKGGSPQSSRSGNTKVKPKVGSVFKSLPKGNFAGSQTSDIASTKLMDDNFSSMIDRMPDAIEGLKAKLLKSGKKIGDLSGIKVMGNALKAIGMAAMPSTSQRAKQEIANRYMPGLYANPKSIMWNKDGSRNAQAYSYAMGGMVKPKYFSIGGLAKGTDVVPSMLTPGEFVMSKYAVDNFGADNLKSINNGTYEGSSVYNYNLSVSMTGSNLNANDVAKTVMAQIKQVDDQRLRGNRLNGN